MFQPDSPAPSPRPSREPRALGPDLDISSLARGLPLGDRIGPYMLHRWIGSGGMGAVFEAERPAPPFRVALKLVPPAHITPDATDRLLAEAAALARLDHPGIVRFVDSGIHSTDSGNIPFLAMQLIESAMDIATFCEHFGLASPDRLALMITVCDAAQHAHERGIVHRDLKPANILIDRLGKPRIIDFGVCRRLDDPSPDRPRSRAAPARTRVGQLVGTLAYMAPEQADADPFRPALDARCDVYALGSVLYQLLTGIPPYDFSTSPTLAAAARARRKPPIRPSRLNPAIRGDLEAIIRRAMHPDPTQRYATAEALAHDLRRFRCGQRIDGGSRDGGAWSSLLQMVRDFLRVRPAFAE